MRYDRSPETITAIGMSSDIRRSLSLQLLGKDQQWGMPRIQGRINLLVPLGDGERPLQFYVRRRTGILRSEYLVVSSAPRLEES